MEKESETYIKIILSNRMGKLADALAGRLFASGSSPFERRMVIVPHEQMKEFLQFYFASKLGIAAGMQIYCVEQGMAQLADKSKRIPSILSLSLSLEEQIHLLLQKNKDPVMEPLYAYIEGDDKRILSLSDKLAGLFLRYSLAGEPFLSPWLAQSGWQQKLWRACMPPFDVSEKNASVHLFGFSYLFPAQLSFFARFYSVFYLFSPCAQYWDDHCSDREKLGILRHLDGSRSQEMQHYLEHHHTLLGNWGKMGREFIKSLDAYLLDIEEMYESSSPTSLLGAVQNSILSLEPLLAVKEAHPSIQVHSAPSKLREVEVLRDVLARYAIEPRDIQVFAPDMRDYAPYIHMVFGKTPYAYRIEGLEKGARSDFYQAFYHFLSFFEEPLTLASVLKLLQFPVVQEKWGLSKEDVGLIGDWLEQAGVRSGEMSWQDGIDRLLLGLSVSSDTDHRLYPCSAVSLSDVDVFDRFIQFWQALRSDIQTMRSSEKKTLAEWLTWVEAAALRHSACDAESEPFFAELKMLNAHTISCFSFISIQRILGHLYTKCSGEMAAAHMQHIRFASMQTGTARPCRIVYLLGMDEEQFPRFEAMDSLSALQKTLTKGDEDRYLFLELLCSASDYFILSYERVHALDNKPQGPSFLIEELCKYVGNMHSLIHHPHLIFNAEKTPPRTFFASEESSLQTPELIRLSSLRKLAKDPIAFYFNEALGIYLDRGDPKEEKERFCLTGLKKYAIRKAALKTDMHTTLKNSERQGILPEGMFKQVALQDLRAELTAWQIDDIISIELSPHCRDPMQVDTSRWVVPAFSFDGQHVIGTLESVSKQGYLVSGKNDIETLITEWPLYLVYLYAGGMIGGFSSTLIFPKEQETLALPLDNPQGHLENFLKYYVRARRILSPLRGKWASTLLLKTEQEFERAVHQDAFYADPYQEWMRYAEIVLDPKQLYATWATDLKALFYPLVKVFE